MKAIKLLVVLASTVVFGSAAGATQQPRSTGDTSGPAAGSPVEPSTVVQKENPFVAGRPTSQSDTAAGAPGMEAARGTQAGAAASDATGKNK
jgi:hypothetical protein